MLVQHDFVCSLFIIIIWINFNDHNLMAGLFRKNQNENDDKNDDDDEDNDV